MTRALRVLALALALSPAFAGGASAEVTGDEARELVRAGCRVRTLEIDARGVATVAAECAWPLAPERVLATLRDPQKLGDSLTSLGEFRRLSDGRVLQVHTIGWPLDDRQVTLDWRESALPEGGMRFDYRRAERQEPLAAGRVGIVEDEGRWLIRPDGAGGTRLSYRSRYDAGGSLKPWLVRRFQRGGIASSLAELRAAVAAR